MVEEELHFHTSLMTIIFILDKERNIGSLEKLYKKLFDNVEQYNILKEKRLQQKNQVDIGNCATNAEKEFSPDIIKRSKLDHDICK